MKSSTSCQKKCLTIANVVEDIKQQELSYTSGRNINCYVYNFLDLNLTTVTPASILQKAYISKLPATMWMAAKKTKRRLMSFQSTMAKLQHIHNGYYISIK